MGLWNISRCFAACFVEWGTWLTFIIMNTRNSAYAVWLGAGISQLKCLQYDWAHEFPDYKKCLTNNFSIDLFISSSHGPSMHTLSLHQQHYKTCSVIHSYRSSLYFSKAKNKAHYTQWFVQAYSRPGENATILNFLICFFLKNFWGLNVYFIFNKYSTRYNRH